MDGMLALSVLKALVAHFARCARLYCASSGYCALANVKLGSKA